ncbi:hypothetical protein Tco_0590559 [Tanacetum coccineum]
MMEWSEMLPEVLERIALKHIAFYEDYLSFAGVCKSWRLAAAARTYHNSNGPPSRLPSLMLAEKSDDHESRELFLLSNKSIRKIRLPEAYAWNVNGKDPAVMVDVAMTPEDVVMTLEYDYHSAYIVGLDDGERKQLLVIIQKGIDYTKSFQVLAYDLQSRNWSKVKDFGTKTLFVGHTSSFWVEDTTGVIKGDSLSHVKTNYIIDPSYRDNNITQWKNGSVSMSKYGTICRGESLDALD